MTLEPLLEEEGFRGEVAFEVFDVVLIEELDVLEEVLAVFELLLEEEEVI